MYRKYRKEKFHPPEPQFFISCLESKLRRLCQCRVRVWITPSIIDAVLLHTLRRAAIIACAFQCSATETPTPSACTTTCCPTTTSSSGPSSTWPTPSPSSSSSSSRSSSMWSVWIYITVVFLFFPNFQHYLSIFKTWAWLPNEIISCSEWKWTKQSL